MSRRVILQRQSYAMGRILRIHQTETQLCSQKHLCSMQSVCWMTDCKISSTVYPKKYAQNMVFALLCFVVVIHWLIFPYPSGLFHWHCGNLTIAPVPAKQPWWIWINTSCEFIMDDCITTTKQSTTKPCAYFLGYTVVTAHSFAFDPTNLDWTGNRLYPQQRKQ